MIMKRFCFLTVVLAAALCIASCNDNNDEKTFGLCLVSVENVGKTLLKNCQRLVSSRLSLLIISAAVNME